jgi:YggT family protein
MSRLAPGRGAGARRALDYSAVGTWKPRNGWQINGMIALLNLIDTVITIYIWVLIASAILSWLVAFNVINTGNRFVYQLGDALYRLTEPALRPIRNVLPNLGGIDISPVVLILVLVFLRDLLNEYFRY